MYICISCIRRMIAIKPSINPILIMNRDFWIFFFLSHKQHNC